MKRVALALLLSSCSHGEAPKPGDRSALVATEREGDDVVATVDGRPIHASDVVTQSKAAGTDAKASLAALIDAEVLAGHANAEDADVVDARKAEENRKYLAMTFERDATADKVPEADLRLAYDKHKLDYEHPEGVELWHLVAMVPKGATPEQKKAVRDKLAALYPKASAAKDDAAFSALADDTPADGIVIKAEHFATPRRGMVEDVFADAAFALDKPGQVSPIVESTYGYHVIRLVQRVPAKHVDYEDARRELRDKLFPAWQQRAFESWINELVSHHTVEKRDAKLAEPVAAVTE